MNNAFKVPETGETALVKPNGTIEFWDGMKMTQDPIPLGSESAALNYVRSKGWKEVPLAV